MSEEADSPTTPFAAAGRRYQMLVDAVVDYAIYMLDLEGRVATWNPGAERMKGYTADEIIGQSFATFFTEEDRKAGKPDRALRTAAETGRFEDEGWRERKDGTAFWAVAVLDAVRDETGRVIGFAKVTRDITERRAAQEALRKSVREFQLLIQGVKDYAIYMLDPGGRITSWNSGAHNIKGYRADEVIGSHFSRFYTEEDRAAGMPARALRTAANEGKFEAEGWRVRKDGSRFWASVVIDPVHDETGELVGFAKVTRDITERRNADEELLQARTELFQAQKMEAIGQLTGGVAHDFNNLLTVVIGNLELAQRTLGSAEGEGRLRRAIGNAMRGAQRAATLTERLLAFSRQQPLEPKPVDVNKLLIGLSDLLGRSLGEHIEIETVGAGGLWRVEVDPVQLEATILNLALNARDAMPDGGKLTIETLNAHLDEHYSLRHAEVRPGQYVQVAITDTGSGMTEEVVTRAFEPFFTTKRVGHGTGLGLSQVYGFVKQSGGHVKIYSEIGLGTTIKIYLPRMQGRVEEEEKEAGGLVGAEESESILLVEDDTDVRAYLAEVLRSLDYRVTTVANVQAALAVLAQKDRKIDLLLTDIVMPEGNGRELAKAAERMRPDIQVLYMTGYSRNAVVHQGRLEEGVDLLQKPVSQAQLAMRVRTALDRRRR
jgi:PAS domain S-box-containing protein